MNPDRTLTADELGVFSPPLDVPNAPSAPPAKVHLSNSATASGATLVISDTDAWVRMDHGIFATGRWNGNGAAVDTFIPYSSIAYMELDFEAIGIRDEADAPKKGKDVPTD